jgi:hypothetical protein
VVRAVLRDIELVEGGPAQGEGILDGFFGVCVVEEPEICKAVAVCVDESGGDGQALEVDCSCIGSGQGEHLAVGADGHDRVAADGDGLCLGECVLHGEDDGIVENEVG